MKIIAEDDIKDLPFVEGDVFLVLPDPSH